MDKYMPAEQEIRATVLRFDSDDGKTPIGVTNSRTMITEDELHALKRIQSALESVGVRTELVHRTWLEMELGIFHIVHGKPTPLGNPVTEAEMSEFIKKADEQSLRQMKENLKKFLYAFSMDGGDDGNESVLARPAYQMLVAHLEQMTKEN